MFQGSIASRVIVCTVASDVPGQRWADYQRTFHELGCEDVVHLRLCAALEEFYRRGGTVAGTSAGASVMAETMLVSGISGETHRIGETLQMAPGLGFLRDTIIDQHGSR